MKGDSGARMRALESVDLYRLGLVNVRFHQMFMSMPRCLRHI
jgi:hypothetical protein